MSAPPGPPVRREPEPVGNVLRRTLTARGWERRYELARIVAAWAEIAGEAVAAHSRPVALTDEGTLVVVADSATWATQLTFLQATVRARLAEVCGPALVRAVQLRTDEAGERARRRRW